MSIFSNWSGGGVSEGVPKSAQQAEKDQAIEIARNALNDATSISMVEARIMARQLLRALALPDKI
jgi:hypothetical protein